MMDSISREAETRIAYTIREVANRGWSDVPLVVDQFAELRNDKRVYEAQIAALYEQYFLPERHEFEWQVLYDIAIAIISAPAVEFATVAIVGGVIGNAAYDMLKTLCSYAASQFEEKLGEKAKERAQGFRQLASDAEQLKSFFSKNQKARIEQIEQSTGIPREKLCPLLKLAGFNHYRRGDPCYWEIPK
jgi:hypothetical protein